VVSEPAERDQHDCEILFFPLPTLSADAGVDDRLLHGGTLLVNEITHNWGYSHVALDCKEFTRDYVKHPPKDESGLCDAPDGVRFAIQARLHCGIHRISHDRLNQVSKRYGRVALKDLGLECAGVCKAARDLVGKPFSLPKWATGAFINWSGYVCVDVVTRGMDVAVQQRMFDALRHKFRHTPLLSRQHHHEFVFSPNGLALACGLDHADKTLTGQGVKLTPHKIF
jgi:hypothetical protein